MNAQELMQVTAIKALTEHIPMNDFGLPVGVYRTDMLPFHNYVEPTHTEANAHADPQTQTHEAQTQAKVPQLVVVPEVKPEELGQRPEESQEDDNDSELLPIEPTQLPTERRIAGFLATDLDIAFVPLYYDEGYPAFINGQAFWEPFEFEPPMAHTAFQRYLQLGLGRKADPEDPEDGGEAASGYRSISELATSMTQADGQLLGDIEQFKTYSCLYYWGLRARAYDLFRVARHRKQQELRAIETHDEHYVTARKLMGRLLTYFDDEEEFWDLMTPKIGIDMLKTVSQLQRVSAGLPIAGPLLPNMVEGAQGGQSLEVILRQVANGATPGTLEEGGVLIDHDTQLLDRALDDPKTTEQMQEIIIRMNAKQLN